MCSAAIRFHGELKDFLRPGNTSGLVRYPLDRRASIKDVIEALGPPHTEVGAIRINGTEAGFEHLLEEGQAVEVMPQPIPIPVTRATLLRPEPLPKIRFIVDVNVGKLANLLRILGFDAAFDHQYRDAQIAEIANVQGRIVLTMDRDLLKRSLVVHGRLIRSHIPEVQLRQVLHDFGLSGPFPLFSRCVRCNVGLVPVPKTEILPRLEPKTRKYFHEFHVCPQCDRIYWQGSHHDKMIKRLKTLQIVA
ncbi:MAG: Mut7-C RNAse domain-containing protein [Desulfovibrionales bacterium]